VAHLADRPAARPVEKGRCTREEHEHGGAKVRDPAGEEQRRLVHIARVEATGREEVAGVIEHHQHHHKTAQ
jgi:hypothetical protein